MGRWGFAGGLAQFDSRCNLGADHFGIDACKTISTVDACNYHPQVSATFGASCAKARGRRGCLVEQYSVPLDPRLPSPAGQWDLTPAMLRAQVIRHLLFGARQFVFHGFCHTDGSDTDARLLSNPRFDFPPGINFEPWFSFHDAISTETARLSAFMQNGQADVRIAVLYPLRTYWAEGPDHPFAAESAFWHRWLSRQGIAFDIIDECQLPDNGQVSDGDIGVLHNYRALILPGAGVVENSGFADLLAAYLQTGGLLLASGPLPAASQQKGADPELKARLAALVAGRPNAAHFPALADRPAAQKRMAALLKRHITPLVQIDADRDTGPPLWSWSAKDGNTWNIALFNDNPRPRAATIRIAEPRLQPEFWDPASGDRWVWPRFAWRAAVTEVFARLEPNQLGCWHLTAADDDPGPRIQSVRGPVRCGGGTRSGRALALEFPTAGKVELDLISHRRPVVSGGRVRTDIVSGNTEQWHLVFQVPPLPPVIRLDRGWQLAQAPGTADRPVDGLNGWQDVWPTFCGTGRYECRFDLDPGALDYRWHLVIRDLAAAVSVYLNTACIGRCGWPPYRLRLPADRLQSSGNRLVLAIANTAGNRYYANTPYAPVAPRPAGLLSAPILAPSLAAGLSG